MKYLIFDNEAKAKERSASMYCCHPQNGTTKYLLSWRVHPKSPIAALCVPDEYEGHLTDKEKTDLINELDKTWEVIQEV